MIVTKYFKDLYDNLKPYEVGENVNFGNKRNKYLEKHGYAKPKAKKPKKQDE